MADGARSPPIPQKEPQSQAHGITSTFPYRNFLAYQCLIIYRVFRLSLSIEVLVEKLRRSLVLSLAERYINLILQIATVAALARILTPVEAGIYTVAAGLVNMAQTIREFGVSNYIIQEADLSPRKLGTALSLSTIFGLILAVLFSSASGSIAAWFNEPRIKDVILILSLNFFIVGISSLGFAQLQRNMNFSALAKISTVMAIGRSTIGITMAYGGYGAVSMAWSSIAGTVIGYIGYCIALGRESFVVPRLADWRPILRFGAVSTGASLLQMSTANAPEIIVGRLLGVGDAGLFSRARSLATLFEGSFMGGIRPVAVTSLARENRAGRATTELYLRFLDHTTMVAWSLLMMMGILAEPLIFVAFGDQWSGAVYPSRLVCLAVSITLVGDLAGSAMTAVGAVRSNLIVYAISTPIHIALIAFFCYAGIEGAAGALCISAVALAALSQSAVNKILGVSWLRVWKVIMTTVSAACVTGIIPLIVVVSRHDTTFPAHFPGWPSCL
jgi:O-antigen/teichoic acid export membrane protein